MKKSLLLGLVATPVLAFAADRDLTVPINTICPVDGMVVDAVRAPIVVSDSTGRHTDLVPIGVCTHAWCAEKVRSDPAAYLDAARRDRIAKIDEPTRGSSAGSVGDGDADGGRTMVMTDPTNAGKPADSAERPLMNDRPNALNLKEDFDNLGSGTDVEIRDEMPADDWNDGSGH